MPRPARHRRHRYSARRLLVLLGLVAAGLVAASGQAGAHPLGNFTVNVHAGLVVAVDEVVVDYVVDLAEIATVQAQPFMDADEDGRITDAERDGYGAAGCARWADEVEVREAGEALPLAVEEVSTRADAGEAGLPVLRVECRLAGPRPGGTGAQTITLVDRSFPDRLGWREVTAVGDGTRLEDSDVPSRSPSARLEDYPAGRLDDPPDQRRARVVVSSAGGPGLPERPAADAVPAALDLGLTGRLDRLVADRGSGPALLGVALLAAVALGGLHALAPGHGKTVVAAYLIGQRGSVRHAGALALSVALTHTLGVLLLGTLLWTAAVSAPERLYPALGVASGAVIAGLGLLLLRRGWRPSHRHHHHHHDGSATADPPLRAGSVVALGFASGLVPTPSALLVLVGALAAGQVWVGMLLVAGYGIGMAVTLVGVGLALAMGQRRLVHRLEHLGLGRLHAVSHALPSVTSGMVVLAGVGLMARSALAA